MTFEARYEAALKALKGSKLTTRRFPCDQKIKYSTVEEALDSLHNTRKHIKKYGKHEWQGDTFNRLHTYQCSHCGYWHLGKKSLK